MFVVYVCMLKPNKTERLRQIVDQCKLKEIENFLKPGVVVVQQLKPPACNTSTHHRCRAWVPADPLSVQLPEYGKAMEETQVSFLAPTQPSPGLVAIWEVSRQIESLFLSLPLNLLPTSSLSLICLSNK